MYKFDLHYDEDLELYRHGGFHPVVFSPTVVRLHGDLTSSNILFQGPADGQTTKSTRLSVETEEIVTLDDSLCVPRELVAPVDAACLSSPSLLQENIIVIDFGQSFATNHPPKDYKPATAIHYFSLEARFENRISPASGTISEIRVGSPLFDPFFGNDTTVVWETVETLGKLPEPWWSAFEHRYMWFEENSRSPRKFKSRKQSYCRQSRAPFNRSCGRSESKANRRGQADEGPMIAVIGTRLEQGEVVLLSDLLERMLRYRPEERITIQEVVRHPWFNYTV
ncbi:kinase-like protein [Amanita muscaria]